MLIDDDKSTVMELEGLKLVGMKGSLCEIASHVLYDLRTS